MTNIEIVFLMVFVIGATLLLAGLLIWAAGGPRGMYQMLESAHTPPVPIEPPTTKAWRRPHLYKRNGWWDAMLPSDADHTYPSYWVDKARDWCHAQNREVIARSMRGAWVERRPDAIVIHRPSGRPGIDY